MLPTLEKAGAPLQVCQLFWAENSPRGSSSIIFEMEMDLRIVNSVLEYIKKSKVCTYTVFENMRLGGSFSNSVWHIMLKVFLEN